MDNFESLYALMQLQEDAKKKEKEQKSPDNMRLILVDLVPAILKDARHVVIIGENDINAQAVKNVGRSEEQKKEPLLTKEQIDEVKRNIKEATDAYNKLMSCIDRIYEVKEIGVAHQTERNIKKKAIKMLGKHCLHCAGHPVKCGCKHGCERPPHVRCKERIEKREVKKSPKVTKKKEEIKEEEMEEEEEEAPKAGPKEEKEVKKTEEKEDKEE